MKQKQPTPGAGKPESADTVAGNKLAEMEGKKATDALSVASQITFAEVVIPSRGLRLQLAEYILGCKPVTTAATSWADNMPIDYVCRQCRGDISSVAMILESHVLSGAVDPETMIWRNRDWGLNGMICFCLVPGCNIGPFIPIKRK